MGWIHGGSVTLRHLQVTVGTAMQHHSNMQNESSLAPRETHYPRVQNDQVQQWDEVLSTAYHG